MIQINLPNNLDSLADKRQVKHKDQSKLNRMKGNLLHNGLNYLVKLIKSNNTTSLMLTHQIILEAKLFHLKVKLLKLLEEKDCSKIRNIKF